jgi:hypothetical protein
MTIQNARKQITISTPRSRYEVGGSIPLNVSYLNGGKEKLTFRDPAMTWEVKLAVSSQETGETQVPFGRKFFYQGEDYQRISIEDADEISLNPGQQHIFALDIGKRWMELFPPGQLTVRIVDKSDDSETVASNSIELAIVFGPNSFANLLNIVPDDDYSLDSRMFAVQWVGQLYAGFRVFLQEPTQAQQAENRSMIRDAQSWWQANQQNPEVLKKIAEINMAAESR